MTTEEIQALFGKPLPERTPATMKRIPSAGQVLIGLSLVALLLYLWASKAQPTAPRDEENRH